MFNKYTYQYILFVETSDIFAWNHVLVLIENLARHVSIVNFPSCKVQKLKLFLLIFSYVYLYTVYFLPAAIKD